MAAAMQRRNPIRHVVDVRDIRPDGNSLILSVTTDGGSAKLCMEKAGEGFQRYGDNGMLLTDSSGNYFVVDDRKKLPKGSQRLLTLYFGD
jgi:hypothetical protein